MTVIIKDISCLVTCRGTAPKKGTEMMDAGIIENGYVVTKEDKILEIGEGNGYEKYITEEATVLDGKGKTVTPGLIDCHTHLVYGGSREAELPLKLKKVGYIEILKNGGGILSTVRQTRAASKEDLKEQATKRLNTMLEHGTTTIESKSGYGLTLESEVKTLEVNKELNKEHPVDIVTTFLGAHAIPEEYKENREGYIDEVINNMLPHVVENNLAEYIDVFCEEGVYTVEESRRILEAGKEKGLGVKLHADEVVSIKGAELAGELGAVSAEHLVAASDEGIKAMADSNVVAVLLPCTSFYLMLDHYANARKMIENNVPVAVSTDCNPGSSPTESLQNVMTFSSFGLGMFPEEVINGMTVNAAYAIGRQDTIGSIEPGKNADIVIFDNKNLKHLMYHFGTNTVEKVIKNGEIVVDRV